MKIVAQTTDAGEAIEKELAGGGAHTYPFVLPADHSFRVEVEQLGIDVELELFAPDGSSLAQCDSPSGAEGIERLAEIAPSSGEYRLEVRSFDPAAPAGRYRLEARPPRPVDERERQLIQAERHFRLGETLRRQEDTAGRSAAIEEYETALGRWRSFDDVVRQADALHRLGWMHHLLANYPAASAVLNAALDLFQTLDDRLWQTITLLQLSTTAYRQQDLSRALETAEEALSLARQRGDQLSQASALIEITKARFAMGSVQLALEASETALATARATGGVEQEVLALYEQGNIFTLQGHLPRAIDSLEKALQIMRQNGVRVEAAAILDRLGTACQRRGEYEKARDYLTRALKWRRKADDRRGESITLGNLGRVELLSGHPEQALRHFRAALDLQSPAGDPLDRAIALINLGRYHYAVGEPGPALKAHEQAERVLETLDRPREAASNLFGSARALFALGRAAEARERLEPVLEAVEDLRFEAAGTDLRMAFFTTKQHYYRLYIDILMELHRREPGTGHDLAALEAHQRRRARGLLDLLTESRAEIRRGADRALIEQEHQLRDQLERLERAILDPRTRPKDGISMDELAKKRRQLQAELADLEVKITTSHPQYQDLTRSEPLGPREIQEQVLDARTALLLYSLGEEQSYVWVVPPQGAVESHVLAAKDQIETAARHTRDAWSELSRKSREKAERWSQALSQMILEPVASHLGRQHSPRRILVVADGFLEHIPFAALPLPKKSSPRDSPVQQEPARPAADAALPPLDPRHPVPVVEHNQVIHLPSASVLASLRQELEDRQGPPAFLGIFADPVFSRDDPRLEATAAAGSSELLADLQRAAQQVGLKELGRLPHTEREAAFLRQLVAEPYRFEALGFEASRQRILGGDLKRFAILHLATHGFMNEEHPELSGLVFSLYDREGRPVDGFLRTHEIYDLDLLAELVVLSACKTGLGEEVEGEGIVGLSRGFMYAGAPRLVVSLWNVDDEGTSELMQRFYRHLLAPEGEAARPRLPAASLRAAQRELLREARWSAPYYWAGFVFQGEWRGTKGSVDDSIEPKPTGEPSDDPDTDLPISGERATPAHGSDLDR